MVGTGDGSFGKTDKNIAEGMPVDEAVEDLVKAIYLKRFQIILGSTFF
jgi:hypothetical protein